MAPASLDEVVRLVNLSRPERVLDGAEWAPFATGNPEIAVREANLYVDLVNQGGELRWIEPGPGPAGFAVNTPGPEVRLVIAMQRSGLFSPDALNAISEAWSAQAESPDTRWLEIRALNVGVLEDSRVAAWQAEGLAQGEIDLVVARWGFPLLWLDLDQVTMSDDQIAAEMVRSKADSGGH